MQGDKASISGFPEESRENSCNTHAEVIAHTHTLLNIFYLLKRSVSKHVCMRVFVKPTGAAAVSSVENTGVCDSASGSVFTHTARAPGPHTPLLSPQHPATIQRIHTEGTTLTET